MLILDEPTAVLTDIEVEGLYTVIEKLNNEGKIIIFISHKMREVLHVSDRVTILRSGRAVRTLLAGETDGKELANLMIGRELIECDYEKVESAEEPVIELRHVDYNKTSKHNGLNDVSIQVRKGEILGVAGVDGNGRAS
jgi:simple sugar transport system ATP-binding protein